MAAFNAAHPAFSAAMAAFNAAHPAFSAAMAAFNAAHPAFSAAMAAFNAAHPAFPAAVAAFNAAHPALDAAGAAGNARVLSLDFVSRAHDARGVPYTYEYPRPAVTVDVVLFAMRADDLAVLLIKRKGAPFKGHWALPGGFVDQHEPLEKAALRELSEETGIAGVSLEQLGAFGDPGRDPRGHTVSVAYLTFVVAESHRVKAGDDAALAAYVPLRELALEGTGARAKKLAFDHSKIILLARDRLRERMNEPVRKNAFEFVPPRFTLTELQRVYEAVFGRTLDKRNFRARVLLRGLVEPEAAARREGRHRPAQLYRWKQPRVRRAR